MPTDRPRIEPPAVVQAVEHYVNSEHDDARKYPDRRPLDPSGVWSLHRVAADVYAQGWNDGERTEADRQRGEWARTREDARARVARVEALIRETVWHASPDAPEGVEESVNTLIQSLAQQVRDVLAEVRAP